MKNIIATTMFALALFACSSESQKEEKTEHKLVVPENVKAVFAHQFPNVKNVEWEKEGKNYEAMFKHSVTETSIVITPEGKILETETEMDSSTLPEAILIYFDTNYRGYKIAEASKIVLSNGTIRYEAEVQDKDFIFDSNGVLLEELD
jgi:hypothetical protein